MIDMTKILQIYDEHGYTLLWIDVSNYSGAEIMDIVNLYTLSNNGCYSGFSFEVIESI